MNSSFSVKFDLDPGNCAFSGDTTVVDWWRRHAVAVSAWGLSVFGIEAMSLDWWVEEDGQRRVEWDRIFALAEQDRENQLLTEAIFFF